MVKRENGWLCAADESYVCVCVCVLRLSHRSKFIVRVVGFDLVFLRTTRLTTILFSNGMFRYNVCGFRLQL